MDRDGDLVSSPTDLGGVQFSEDMREGMKAHHYHQAADASTDDNRLKCMHKHPAILSCRQSTLGQSLLISALVRARSAYPERSLVTENQLSCFHCLSPLINTL